LPKDQVGDLIDQVKEAGSEELEAFIQQMQQGQTQQGPGECIFCKIIKKEMDAIRIFEDNDIIVLLDIMPATKGHVIIMPKQHIRFIQEIDNILLNKIMNFVKLLSPVLVEVLKAKGLSIYIPQGIAAGQNVGHFYINLIPRYDKDEVAIDWKREKKSNKELENIAETLKKAASKRVVSQLEEEKEKLMKHDKVRQESEAEQMYKHVKKRRP
jgi:histidine triad (HIT) family protein